MPSAGEESSKCVTLIFSFPKRAMKFVSRFKIESAYFKANRSGCQERLEASGGSRSELSEEVNSL